MTGPMTGWFVLPVSAQFSVAPSPPGGRLLQLCDALPGLSESENRHQCDPQDSDGN